MNSEKNAGFRKAPNVDRGYLTFHENRTVGGNDKRRGAQETGQSGGKSLSPGWRSNYPRNRSGPAREIRRADMEWENNTPY